MTQPGRLRSFFIALFAYAAGVTSPGAAWGQQATANTRVYTVEIVVFRNMGGTGGTEDWTAKPVARGPDNPDSPVTGRFIQTIPAAQFKLNALDQKLQNTANYQPIAHFAWQQTASSWGSRAGFSITKLAGNVPGLSGNIFLEAGDYLHLGMTLNYQTSNPPTGLSAPPGTVFTMSESRRVKWDQLNYYDHPAFGVVALVTPADRGSGGR